LSGGVIIDSLQIHCKQNFSVGKKNICSAVEEVGRGTGGGKEKKKKEEGGWGEESLWWRVQKKKNKNKLNTII
jgi:hypothetical protein